MRLLDRANAAQAMRRKDEARLGVPGPIGAGAIEQIHELLAGAAGRQRAVNGELTDRGRFSHRPRETRKQELEQRVVLAALELEACRHGVTAAFDEEPFMHGRPHHGAEVDRGDRARRACRETVRLERSDEGWKAEALGDAAGDQSEQPLVPAFGAEKEQRPAGLELQVRQGRRPPRASAPRLPSARH